MIGNEMKRFMSILLIFAMVLSIFPVGVLAASPEPFETTISNVSQLEIKTAPEKTIYQVGERLDLAGLELTVTEEVYNNETGETTTDSYDIRSTDTSFDQDFTVVPAKDAELTSQDTVVTITHIASGQTVEQQITVEGAVSEGKHILTVVAGAGGTVNTTGGEYESSAEVDLIATPEVGYKFTGWSVTGSGSVADSSQAITTFTLGEEDAVVTALFEEKTYTLSFKGSQGVIKYTGNGTFKGGETIPISVVLSPYYELVTWEASKAGGSFENPAALSTHYTLPEDMDAAAIDLSVVVRKVQPTLNLEDGSYEVAVQAWKETSDVESYLNGLLDSTARLTIENNKITVSVKIIDGVVETPFFPYPASGADVPEAWYNVRSSEVTAGTGEAGYYKEEDKSRTFTFELTEMVDPYLTLLITPMGNAIMTARLHFDWDTLIEENTPPVEEGYTITINEAEGGKGIIKSALDPANGYASIALPREKFETGVYINLGITDIEEGYQFVTWQIDSGTVARFSALNDKDYANFDVGTTDVVLTPVFKRTTVDIIQKEHGTVTVEKVADGTEVFTGTQILKGTELEIIPQADEGYRAALVKVKYLNDYANTAVVYPDTDGKYKFTMPERTVEVFVEFREALYQVTLEKEGQGTVTYAPVSDKYATGEQIAFTAIPAEGWVFVGWHVERDNYPNAFHTGSEWKYDVFTTDAMIKAVFGQETLAFALSQAENGTAEITTNSKEKYAKGERIVIKATPDEGYAFSHWETQGGNVLGAKDDWTSFTIEQDDASATPVFVKKQQVTLVTNETDSGTIKVKERYGETRPAVYSYKAGQVLEIEATPLEGWKFDKWETTDQAGIFADNTAAKTTYTVSTSVEDVTIRAVFVQDVSAEIPDGNYTLNVVAFKEGTTAPSVMAALLDPTAKLTVQGGKYTVTVTFITGSIYGVPVKGNDVGEVWPERTSVAMGEVGSGLKGTFDEQSGSATFTFEVSTLVNPRLHMYVVPMDVIMAIDLGFDKGTLNPKILTGSAEGFGGQLRVKVTMDGDEITAIEVVSHNETAGISDPALTQIPAAIIEAQSADVDVVAGATATSNAIKNAVKSALAQEAQKHALTVIAGEGGSVNTADGQYKQGTQVNLTATPNAGYKFKEWTSDNGGSFGSVTSEATIFTMPAGATKVTAHFERDASGTTEYEDGIYEINVKGWHEYNDTPSLMASALDGKAILQIDNDEITATIKFIKTTLFGINIDGREAEELWPEPTGALERGTGIRGIYNEADGSQSYSFVISSLDLPKIGTYVKTMDSIQRLRLNFDKDSMRKIGELPTDNEQPDWDAAVKLPESVVDLDDNEVKIDKKALQDWINLLSDKQKLTATTAVELAKGEDSETIDSVIIPVAVLQAHISDESVTALRIVKDATTAADKQGAIAALPSETKSLEEFDLKLQKVFADGRTEDTHQLNGEIKVVIGLTDQQATEIGKGTPTLYYYNPASKQLENMNAVFNGNAKTATFYTNHLSVYLIALTQKTVTPGPGSGGGGGDKPLDPDDLPDGSYTISARALKETIDEPSMCDPLIWGNLQISVSGGKMEVRMIMLGTESLPMKEVKTLWYRNPAGDYTRADMYFDESSNTITFRFPVTSITQPLYMQVEVPMVTNSMPSLPIFRLIFDTGTLERGGSVNNPSDAPPATIADSFVIKASAGEGGTITPNGDVKVDKGKDQEFKIKANEGYKIKHVIVDGKSVGAVETYTFKNVEKTATISVAFEKIEKAPVVVPGKVDAESDLEAELAKIVFDDTKGHWAEKAIQRVVYKGLFKGITDKEFAPSLTMTRGMIVTVLGRLSKAEDENYVTIPFADVDSQLYYAPYIAWAADKGIVNGLGNKMFAPNQAITREQLAVILSNYAKFAGIDLAAVESEVPAEAFADADLISEWAKQSVELMKRAGIMQGRENNLFDPQATATRAEVATIITRILDILDRETESSEVADREGVTGDKDAN